MRRTFQNNIAAFPAVAAIGTALRKIFLAPKTATAVAAVPGLPKHFRLIDKHNALPENIFQGSGQAGKIEIGTDNRRLQISFKQEKQSTGKVCVYPKKVIAVLQRAS
jgi:hypothetical protein